MVASRRDFLRFVSSFTAAGVSHAVVAAGTQRFVLRSCYVAGFQFHDGLAIRSTLHVGDTIDLVAEPTNPHDASAVRLIHAGRPIGYLPRGENTTIARLLRQYAPLVGRIVSVDPHAPLWEAVRVEVAMVV